MSDYDVVIIGGGPAGLSAGLYAARAKLKTVLIERGMPGGQAATTDMIENYPGFPEGIPGPDLMMNMDIQARRFGVEPKFTDVLAVAELPAGGFQVKTYDGDITTKTVIIAAGALSKPLGIPGEEEFRGRGVSYCATCDGAFFQGKKVAVIGGGDSSVQEAIYLTKFAEKVYIIHRRDEFRATKVLQEKARSNNQIEFIMDSVVTNVIGNQQVEAIKVKNLKSDEEKAVAVDGVFVYIGKVPSTELVKGFVDTDERGYIITDARMQTSRSGVFAAGDARQTPLRQVVTAAADGAVAAVSAEEYIEFLNK
ncbi:thioredoxin-disulfide reductase [Phosphitispora sp. TUW77]|uniref:thioredoxin-disulfide reductase n=1 Tax=Phosphitispora sp. TUW77 TaxID=3152361 RepID=UPI003AB312B6